MAAESHRGSRRLAARYVNRGYRSLLSRAAERMEVYLFAGCGVSRRIAGGDDCLQNPASSMGQGTRADGKKDTSAGVAQPCAVADQGGSLVSPDGEFKLSIDGRAFRVAAAGHGDPLLPGLVSDGVYRPAIISGFHIFHLKFLSGFATRAVSKDLAASIDLSAISHGFGDWIDSHEHQSCDRSADRKAECVCAYAKISRRVETGQSWR